MPTQAAQPCSDPQSYVLLNCQAERAAPARPNDPDGPPRGSLALAVLDLRSPWPATESMEAAFRALHDRLRKGGTIAVLVDLWSLSHVHLALERKFAQARFVEVVWPEPAADFHPGDNRLMAITAVKGGGSTFNSAYNNGLFTDAADRDPLTIMLEELFANHTNPGDTAALAPEIAGRLDADGFAFPHRTRPTPPPKTDKPRRGRHAAA